MLRFIESQPYFDHNFAGLIKQRSINFRLNTTKIPKDLYLSVTNLSFRQEYRKNGYIKCGKDINLSIAEIKQKCISSIENEQASILISHYAVLRNVYVNSIGSWGYKNKFHILPRKWFGRYYTRSWHERKEGFLRYIVDDLIFSAEGHAHHQFGHFHNDWLVPIVLIPEHILQKCYVMCPKKPGFVAEGLKMIGFRESQLLPELGRDFAFAKRFHTLIDKRPDLTYYGESCNIFRKKITEKMHLDTIPAIRYCLSNRKKGHWRVLKNFDSVVEAANKTFPQINWEILQDYFPTLTETAKVWASIKLVCAPTGSNIVKSLYMHEGSVLVVGIADGLDYAQMYTAAGAKHFFYAFRVPGMKHFYDKKVEWDADIPLTMLALKNGIYAAKYKTFPLTENFDL